MSKCGIPQGSVVDPLLSVLYISPVSTLISSLYLHYQLYADDAQLFFSFYSSDPDMQISCLQNSLQVISSCMSANLLTVSSSITEFLLISLKQQLLIVNSSCLNTCHSARNLGFIIDEHLSFTEQIDALSKSCYSHIHQLRAFNLTLTSKLSVPSSPLWFQT